MTFPPWPHYEEEEIIAAQEVITSGKVNYWTGTKGRNFEKEFANWCGTNYAVALANGSVSLTAAYKALDLKEGDEIITTPRTFIATASSAAILGIKPVFADVDRNSGNISADTIEKLINPKTKAISVVHLGGWPADMKAICDLSSEYGLLVVEDCAQAHGASIDGKKVGSFGDIASWSFCNDKIMSTLGEGGMVTTNSENLYEFVWSFKDHGKDFKLVNKNENLPGYKWLHADFGTNFRLTEIQSAIGSIQLKKLSKWHKIRKRNAKILYETLKGINYLRIPMPETNYDHAWYKFYCYLNQNHFRSGWGRTRIVQEINKRGYPAFHGGCSEVYLEKCFKNSDFDNKNYLINARELGETSLMFLVHPTINEEIMTDYSETIRKIIDEALVSDNCI